MEILSSFTFNAISDIFGFDPIFLLFVFFQCYLCSLFSFFQISQLFLHFIFLIFTFLCSSFSFFWISHLFFTFHFPSYQIISNTVFYYSMYPGIRSYLKLMLLLFPMQCKSFKSLYIYSLSSFHEIIGHVFQVCIF